MTTTIPLCEYQRTPIKDVTEPNNGMVMVYKDRYWVVTPEEEILRYKGFSWQCNPQEQIVQRLCPEGCNVRLIPLVFIPVNPHDYC